MDKWNSPSARIVVQLAVSRTVEMAHAEGTAVRSFKSPFVQNRKVFTDRRLADPEMLRDWKREPRSKAICAESAGILKIDGRCLRRYRIIVVVDD